MEKSRRMYRNKIVSIVIIICCLFGTFHVSEASQSVGAEFEQFTQELFARELTHDTMTKNALVAYPKEYGIKEYTPCFPLFSIRQFKRDIKSSEEVVKELKKFDYDKLTQKQQDLYDTILFWFDNPKQTEKFMYYEQNLNPYLGIHASLPSSLMDYNFTTKEDFFEYLKLLKCIPGYFENILRYEQKRSRAGLFMSDRQLDEVIETCNTFIKEKEKNALIVVFNETIDRYKGLTKEEVKELKEQNKKAVLEYVIPAYEDLVQGIDKLRGTGVNESGLCHLKHGKKYYEYLAKLYTGSSMTVKEMKKAISKKFAEIVVEVQGLIMKHPDLVDEVVNENSAYTKPDEILKRLKEEASKNYPSIEGLECYTKYVDESLEDSSAPAFVYIPQIDGIQDNCIYINGADEHVASDLFTTIAHEGYPGHLYQLNYFKQKKNNPLFSLYQSRGYMEAWALNAQLQAYHWDGYSEEVAQFLEANFLITTLAQVLLDIGVNYEGWTKEQAYNYLTSMGFEGYEQYLYEYSLNVPAYDLCYAIGYIELDNLRKTAKETLKEKFELKEFYRFYLDMGPVPFEVIQKRMPAWLDTQAKN